MQPTPPEDAGLPATSLGLVLGLTALLVSLLLETAAVGRAALFGLGAGLVAALSLWLVGWERWRAVGTFLASLLVAPVAVGLVAAVAESVLRAWPRGGGVVGVAATVLVTLGCVTAVFGAAASMRRALDTTRAARYTNVAVRTTFVTLLVAATLLVSALADGSDAFGGALLDPVLGVLFDPVAGRTHLGVFTLLAAAAAVAFGRALAALPLTELLPDTGDGLHPHPSAAAERVQRAVVLGGSFALVLGATLVVVELAVPERAIAAALPTGGYDLLVGLTGTPWLRQALWNLLVGSLAVALAAWLLRRAVRSSADRVGTVLAPYAGGAVLALAVLALADQAVARLTGATADGSVPAIALTRAVELAGPGPLLLSLTVVVASLTIVLAGALWLSLSVGYVAERTAGVAVAAAGLLLASAFAAAVGAPTLLVLAGLVGAVVVWDAGEFGTTLRREVGPLADTRRAELVHTGGTVAVGCVGAAVTVALAGSVPVPADAALAGLVACLVAVVALVTALR